MSRRARLGRTVSSKGTGMRLLPPLSSLPPSSRPRWRRPGRSGGRSPWRWRVSTLVAVKVPLVRSGISEPRTWVRGRSPRVLRHRQPRTGRGRRDSDVGDTTMENARKLDIPALRDDPELFHRSARALHEIAKLPDRTMPRDEARAYLRGLSTARYRRCSRLRKEAYGPEAQDFDIDTACEERGMLVPHLAYED